VSRQLDDLSSDFKPLAIEVIARCVEQGVMILIVSTGRTWAEHQTNLANGTSWTARSKHLPRSIRGIHSGTADDDKSDAMDLCPYEVYTSAPGGDKLGWDSKHPGWKIIGGIGEDLGLRWGGRWTTPDFGHLEYVFPTMLHT
jgi:hypothetical protein